MKETEWHLLTQESSDLTVKYTFCSVNKVVLITLLLRTQRYAFNTVYCTDKSERNEEFRETLPVEAESQTAIPSGDIRENAISLLLNFEITEVQQQI